MGEETEGSGEDEAEEIMRVGDDSATTLLIISKAVEKLGSSWTACVPASLLADIWAGRDGSLTIVLDREGPSESTSGCTNETEAG